MAWPPPEFETPPYADSGAEEWSPDVIPIEDEIASAPLVESLHGRYDDELPPDYVQAMEDIPILESLEGRYEEEIPDQTVAEGEIPVVAPEAEFAPEEFAIPQPTGAFDPTATAVDVSADGEGGAALFPPPDPGLEPPKGLPPVAGEEQDPLTIGEQAQSYVARGPESLALAQAQAEAERRREQSEAVKNALIRDTEQREDNLRAYQKAEARATAKMDAIAEEAKHLGEKEIDPKAWYKNASTGQKIAAFASAAIQGWLNPTGPNSAVDRIAKLIEQNIAAQKFDLQNQREMLGERRGAVSDSFAGSGNAFRSAEAARQAAFNNEIRKIESSLQGFDPEGTAARNAAQVITGLRQRQAAALEEARQRALKESLEIEKAQLERDKFGLDQKKFAHDRAMDWQQAARAAKAAEVNPNNIVYSGKTGKPLAEIPEGVQGGRIKEFNDRDRIINESARQLTDLYKSIQEYKGSLAPDAVATWDSPEAAKLRAKWIDAMLLYKVAVTGAAANKEEMKTIRNRMPPPSWLRDKDSSEAVFRSHIEGLAEARRHEFNKIGAGEGAEEAASELVRGIEIADSASQTVGDLETVVKTDDDPDARLQGIQDLQRRMKGRDPDIVLRPDIRDTVEEGLHYVETEGDSAQRKAAKKLRQNFNRELNRARIRLRQQRADEQGPRRVIPSGSAGRMY